MHGNRKEIGACQARSAGKDGEWLLNGCVASFWGDEGGAELDKGVVTLHREYPECHCVVHFKMVNFLCCVTLLQG